MNRTRVVKSMTEQGYLTRRQAVITLCALLTLLLGVSLTGLAVGSEKIAALRILAAIPGYLTGDPTGLTVEQETILFGIRLPRIALAIGVGAALALAGAAFQSLLRNPLADPYVLGISSGAALGTIVALIFLPALPGGQTIGGFLGASGAMLFVYGLGRREDDPAHLVLAGVVISTLLSALIVLLTAVADHLHLRRITLWLLGDLSGGTGDGAVLLLSIVVVAGVALTGRARELNLLMIGERDAFALGVETGKVRWLVYLLASMLTAAAVSAGGAIGYVGLVIPHLIRLGGGADNRLVIPASAIGGAVLVVLADTIARTAISPRELPTGAITAVIGAPIFLYLLVRGRR